MEKNKMLELTDGDVSKGLIKLVVPMILGNLLNIAYNIVDTIWIGQMIGPKGLGAIAVSFPIILILMAIASGVTVAANILIGQYFGADDKASVFYISKVATTISLITALALSVIGYIFAPSLMIFLNTADSIMEYSVSYFRISMIGFPFMFYYFLVSALLRGIGDTVRPLIFLAISSILNLILDPLMIKGIGPFPSMGLDGAAYATAFSQFISVAVSMIYLKMKDSIVRANPFNLTFDFRITKLMFRIGIPFAAMQLIVSVSWLFLNRLINTYGESASASVAVSMRVDSLSFLPLMALSAGIATMAAQNIGAGKIERVKEIYKAGMKLSVCISAFMAVFSMMFPEIIVRMFTDDMSVLKYTKSYIYVVMPSIIMLAVMFSANGVINGAGKTFILMLFAFCAHIIIRVPLAYIISPKMELWGIWTAMAISNFFSMTFSLIYYYSNKWKKGSNIAAYNNI
ncbi:MATE family efflux transporter [uncultured Brachyspira sp.]|uniref:MATE family efflux transporter n=1 Tax=uncultured Brachyspira sp. TaxID=221953 RepID=UPI0025E30F38|nr:MATE family efflux transporter [uncultured Brachyspira sp.]